MCPKNVHHMRFQTKYSHNLLVFSLNFVKHHRNASKILE